MNQIFLRSLNEARFVIFGLNMPGHDGTIYFFPLCGWNLSSLELWQRDYFDLIVFCIFFIPVRALAIELLRSCFFRMKYFLHVTPTGWSWLRFSLKYINKSDIKDYHRFRCGDTSSRTRINWDFLTPPSKWIVLCCEQLISLFFHTIQIFQKIINN